MGDEDGGAVLRQLVQGLLHLFLCLGIQRRGGFVEDHHRRISKKYASNGDALLLSAGELHAPLAYLRIVAMRELFDEIIGGGQFRSPLDFFFRRVFPAVGDIFRDGVTEEEYVLLHHADVFAQVPLGHVTKFLPVQCDGALAGFIETKEQVYKGALPRSRLAHEGHRLSGGDVEGEMVENGASLVITKGHVAEIDVPFHPAQGNRMHRVLDGRLGIHDFLEPLESRHAPLVHLRQDGQAEDRLHEDIHIEQKCHEIGQEQRPFVNHPPAGEDHHHIDEVRKEIDAPGEIGDQLIRRKSRIPQLLTFR